MVLSAKGAAEEVGGASSDGGGEFEFLAKTLLACSSFWLECTTRRARTFFEVV